MYSCVFSFLKVPSHERNGNGCRYLCTCTYMIVHVEIFMVLIFV